MVVVKLKQKLTIPTQNCFQILFVWLFLWKGKTFFSVVVKSSVLSQSTVSHFSPFFFRSQIYGFVTLTGLPGSDYMSHWYLRPWTPPNTAPSPDCIGSIGKEINDLLLLAISGNRKVKKSFFLFLEKKKNLSRLGVLFIKTHYTAYDHNILWDMSYPWLGFLFVCALTLSNTHLINVFDTWCR